MSDLSLEIKKLADKYRNNKKSGLLDMQDLSSEKITETYDVNLVSNDEESQEFDGKNLDFLEKEVMDFDASKDFIANENISAKSFANEENMVDKKEAVEKKAEIQISDFINPTVNVTGFDEVEINEDEENVEGSRKSVSENLRVISRNLRDLKALLRG